MDGWDDNEEVVDPKVPASAESKICLDPYDWSQLVDLETQYRQLKIQFQIMNITNLIQTDQWSGSNDVYCVVYSGGTEIGRTEILQNVREPVWFDALYELQIPLDVSLLEVRIEVWDEDKGEEDDFLGMVTLSAQELFVLGSNKKGFQLKPKPGLSQENVQGTMNLCRVKMVKLNIQILAAIDLLLTDEFGGGNDTYCVVYFRDKKIGRTPTVSGALLFYSALLM